MPLPVVLADEQPGAHLHADSLQPLDFRQQVHRVNHHAVADVAGHTLAHDAGGDELEGGLSAIDDQGMPRVVPALKADHPLGVVRQPIHHLAFALVTPLGANDDHVTPSGRCIHF